MKKLIALILILVCITTSVYAEGILSPEQMMWISFSSWMKTTCGVDLKEIKYNRDNNARIFPCNGYDVIFYLTENNEIEKAGIRLKDESSSSEFLMACMAMIDMLGKMDYTAYGTMIFEYSQVLKGEDFILPGTIGLDNFSMGSSDAYKVLFIYLNNDLEHR